MYESEDRNGGGKGVENFIDDLLLNS